MTDSTTKPEDMAPKVEADPWDGWVPTRGQAVDLVVAAAAAGVATWLMWDKWMLLSQSAQTLHQMKQAHMGMAAVVVGSGGAGFGASWAARAAGRGVVAGFRAVCMEGWLVGKLMDFVNDVTGTSRSFKDEAASAVAKQLDGQKQWIVSAVNAEGEALNATVMSAGRYKKFMKQMEQRSVPVLEMHFEGDQLARIAATHKGEQVAASSLPDFAELLGELREDRIAPDAIDTYNHRQP